MSILEQNFSSRHRLTKPSEFKEVKKSAGHLANDYFLILYKPNSLQIARLGIIVRRKDFHLAVTRNKIKRLIRESFRRSKYILQGLDVVVIVKKNCSVGQRNMVCLLSGAWKKIKNA